MSESTSIHTVGNMFAITDKRLCISRWKFFRPDSFFAILLRRLRRGDVWQLGMTFVLYSATGIRGAEIDSGENSRPASADVVAKPVTVSPEPPGLDGPPLKDASNWSEILRSVVLTAIPDKYEDLRHWGKTNEIFAGVKVQQRGIHLRVSERKRTVKHGAWHRYKIQLADPARHLKLVINQIRPATTGQRGQFEFDIRVGAKLLCRADFEHWLLGVKGLNFTTVSEADVQMIAHCQLAIRMESKKGSLLPDLVLEPQVNRVELFLSNLETRRIGELRGDVAEGIGDASRHYIENLLQAQEARVVKKANQALEKNRNRLRISIPRL